MMTSQTFAKSAGKKPAKVLKKKVNRILHALKAASNGGEKKKRDGVVWSRV